MHLLVLDDDERVSAFLASVAEDRGWSVATAGTEAKFRDNYRARLPDVIMLDLQLGASDGVEQLRFLAQEKYAGSIVLMSGFDSRVLASAQQVGKSLGLAVAAVIEKPARVARVRAVLAEIELGMGHGANVPSRPVTSSVQPTSQPLLITPTLIAQAIDGGEMELYLQPIVTAIDRAATRAEGLLRWNHPIAGIIPPDQFIPSAEQDQDVIDRLTTWVIGAGAEQYRQLADLGFDLRISVNISGRNLHPLDFPDQLEALLQRSAVPSGAIALEITESVAMHDLRATTDILTRLRLKGFELAIDDFGTGHSTLEALRRMPFSTIKIDRNFVGGLPGSRDSLAIVKSIIDLARNMGLTSVAEGVESEEVASLLDDLGINAQQGNYFSPALPFDAFVTWLRAWPDNTGRRLRARC